VGVIYGETSNKAMMTGTGFLIAGDLVLTVAHNVYSRSNRERFQRLVFYPGVSGELANSAPFRVIDVRYSKQFETCPGKDTLDHDYALLKLERRVARPAYIKLGLEYIEQKEEVCLSGYPGNACNEDVAIQSYLWKGGHHVEGTALNHWLTTF
jgi:V8-like Glu-specific endopeptidase